MSKKLSVLGGIGACGIVVLGWSAVRQYQLLLQARRECLGDMLPLFCKKGTFHVCRLVQIGVRRGTFFFAQRHMATIREAIKAFGGEMVYTGLSIPHMNTLSTQLLEEVGSISNSDEPLRFEAVAVLRFPSEDQYRRFKAQEDQGQAGHKTPYYDLGFEQGSWTSLYLFSLLFGMRLRAMIFGSPSKHIEKQAIQAATEEQKEGTMTAEAESGGETVVSVEFSLSPETAEDRKRAARAGFQKLALAAAAKRMHGPMYRGRAKTLVGKALFDEVSVIWYPGVSYFTRLQQSEFFASLSPPRVVLGDRLVIPTVPLLVPEVGP